MVTTVMSISFDEKVLSKVDKLRGDISRSAMVNAILKQVLEQDLVYLKDNRVAIGQHS